MSKPPTIPADAERSASGRLTVTVPQNLNLAVRLAAEARKVPVSDFVRSALHEQLARDAQAPASRSKA